MKRCFCLFLILILIPVFEAQAENALKNPRFQDWTDGCPKSWHTTLGAATGVGPQSKLVKNKERGVALTGDAKTKRWTLLKQSSPAQPGKMAPLLLPNGVTVYYSRWVSMLPSGEAFEGKGLQPDIVLRHKSGPEDLVLKRARAALKKALDTQ